MSNENIIFLDFDGVLTSARASVMDMDTAVTNAMDPIALKMLSMLISDFDCRIVLTTSWAMYSDYSKDKNKFTDLFRVLGYSKIANSIHKDWRVIEDYNKAQSLSRNPRSLAIDEWLNCHSPINFIILDDDMIAENEYQLEHIVNTDQMNGMLFNHYLKAREILNKND